MRGTRTDLIRVLHEGHSCAQAVECICQDLADDVIREWLPHVDPDAIL